VPVSERRARIVQYNLAQIGLDVDLEVLAPEVLMSRLVRAGEPWDMSFFAWVQDWADPADWIVPHFHGRSIPRNQSDGSFYSFRRNFSRLDVRALNGRIDAASVLSGNRRYRTFSEIERDILRRYVPMAPLLHLTDRILVSRRVGCVVYNPALGGLDYGSICLR
jgi:ABC-type transport system substrate-binding protein